MSNNNFIITKNLEIKMNKLNSNVLKLTLSLPTVSSLCKSNFFSSSVIASVELNCVFGSQSADVHCGSDYDGDYFFWLEFPSGVTKSFFKVSKSSLSNKRLIKKSLKKFLAKC